MIKLAAGLLLVAAIAGLAAAEDARQAFGGLGRAGAPSSLKELWNPANAGKAPALATGNIPAGDWFAQACWNGTSSGWKPVCINAPVAAAADNATTPEEPAPTVVADLGIDGYKEALSLSFLFYEAQRSGALPASNRIPWRGDSFLDDLVVGGYHDAGDTIKHSLTMAQVVYFLAWSGLEFREGYLAAGEMENLKAAVRWGADYLRRCHLEGERFLGLIGSAPIDHSKWERPEDWDGSMERPAYIWDLKMQGASDLLGVTAAALASSALLFEREAPEYAAGLVRKAELLYKYGKKTPGLYWETHPEYKAMAEPVWLYLTSSWEDELAVAAAWLYKATKNRAYLDDAFGLYLAAGGRWEIDPYISWADMWPAATTLLIDIGLKIGHDKVPGFAQYQDFMRTTFLQSYVSANNTWSIVKTPRGLRVYNWSKWGNLRYASNAAFISLLYANQLRPGDLKDTAIAFAKQQIDYALGSSGPSYQVGFGSNYPQQPHHAPASCPPKPKPCGWRVGFDNPGPNPHILYGALVAGPSGCYMLDGSCPENPKERLDNSFLDKRWDYESNEVAIDYNAGFTGALAGLVALNP